MIAFTIPGPPQGKARARTCRNGHFYTPENTVLLYLLQGAQYLTITVLIHGNFATRIDHFLILHPSTYANRCHPHKHTIAATL